MKALINLAQELYKLKQENESLKNKNDELNEHMIINEENIISTMLACSELYEMILDVEEINIYGLKDTVRNMSNAMIQIYVKLIQKGLKTIDDVPVRLRDAVESELKGDE